MYLSIILFPFLGFIISIFFGRYIGSKGSSFISTMFLFLSFLLSTVAFYKVGLCGEVVSFKLGSWFSSSTFKVSWGFLFDSLTVTMLIVVTSISTLVHFYSIELMSGDPHRSRFMSYLSLFTFFMLILVTADNLVQMFIGWEGVGLASYLLINFWFTRIQANKAAIKAMIVNRIGDLGLALGIMACFLYFGSVDLEIIFPLVGYFFENFNEPTQFLFLFNVKPISAIAFFIFIGAVGKSAQLGLHTWLPDAMEGPTPVSALIHAATMVTAGVFLISRCSPIFEYSGGVLDIVVFFGAMTAFFAATTGLVQNDLKRVIAYSTCSQLGYMVFACGLSAYQVGIFHLANHAFFKALLFLSAGSVIHSMADEQDMRKMGGLVKILPFTLAMVFIGSISLMGFPFMTGFYSKDVIIEVALGSYTSIGHFAHCLGSIGAFFTAFYSIRLLYLTFLEEPQGRKHAYTNSHDAPFFMFLPMFILSFGSIFIGYIGRDLFIGLGSFFWQNAIFVLPVHEKLLLSEFGVPFSVKLIPVIFSLMGACLGFVLYMYFKEYTFNLKSGSFKGLLVFLSKKWFFDKILNDFIVQNFINFGYKVSYKQVDRGIIEILGPFGVAFKIYSQGKLHSIFQTGYIYHYLFIMLVGISFFMFFIVNIL